VNDGQLAPSHRLSHDVLRLDVAGKRAVANHGVEWSDGDRLMSVESLLALQALSTAAFWSAIALTGPNGCRSGHSERFRYQAPTARDPRASRASDIGCSTIWRRAVGRLPRRRADSRARAHSSVASADLADPQSRAVA